MHYICVKRLKGPCVHLLCALRCREVGPGASKCAAVVLRPPRRAIGLVFRVSLLLGFPHLFSSVCGFFVCAFGASFTTCRL